MYEQIIRVFLVSVKEDPEGVETVTSSFRCFLFHNEEIIFIDLFFKTLADVNVGEQLQHVLT